MTNSTDDEHPRVSDEVLLDDFRGVRAKAGRRPRIEDIEAHSDYSYRTFHERFGGVIPAAEAADAHHGSDEWESPKGYGDNDADAVLGEYEIQTCTHCGAEYKRKPDHLPKCDGRDHSPLGVESDD